MTPADVLEEAAVAGIGVRLRDDGTPALDCPPGVGPNAALMAALKEHRAGIIRLLGGVPEPQRCDGFTFTRRVKDEAVETVVSCSAWVYEPVDANWWCVFRDCPFRRRVRGHG